MSKFKHFRTAPPPTITTKKNKKTGRISQQKKKTEIERWLGMNKGDKKRNSRHNNKKAKGTKKKHLKIKPGINNGAKIKQQMKTKERGNK